ncbi:MAG: hypothetical protein ACI4PE_00190 [Bacilli bacterium]
MKEKQEYFITKISDRKDNYYQYYRTLEVDKLGNPTEEEIDKLKELEEDRETVFMIADTEMSIISFKNNDKLKKAVKQEYVNNFNDKELKTIKYRTKEEVKSSIQKLLYLLEIKNSLKEEKKLSKKVK